MKLKNKIAVITGAGKGIGKAVAGLFLKEGARVVMVSRSKKDLDLISAKFKSKKYELLSIAGDVSKEKTVNEIIKKTIKRYKRIDILINNAGFSFFNDMVKSTTKEFDAMFNTNVKAAYLLTRGFLPYMINQNEGTIINIASLAGKQGFATGTIYCATKHALLGISRALMLEVRKYNIRVIAVCPGTVDTDFFRRESNTVLYARKDTVVKPEDVASTCLYAAALPINATASEIEVRPTNPQK